MDSLYNKQFAKEYFNTKMSLDSIEFEPKTNGFVICSGLLHAESKG